MGFCLLLWLDYAFTGGPSCRGPYCLRTICSSTRIVFHHPELQLRFKLPHFSLFRWESMLIFTLPFSCLNVSRLRPRSHRSCWREEVRYPNCRKVMRVALVALRSWKAWRVSFSGREMSGQVVKWLEICYYCYYPFWGREMWRKPTTY
jgi:hypothetical protein